MSKEIKLRKFLRKEIRPSRIPEQQGSAEIVQPPADLLRVVNTERPNVELIGIGDSDLASIVGVIESQARRTRKSKQQLIETLLTESPTQGKSTKNIEAQAPRNPKLKRLKEELGEIVTRRLHFQQEKAATQRQLLICKIQKIEAEDCLQEKQKFECRQVEKLPEPLSVSEKQQLVKAYRRASLAAAGLEKRKNKRSRKCYQHDLDLDGEERLRLGKTLKLPRTDVTGRWIVDVHGSYAASRRLVDEEDEGPGSSSLKERKLLRSRYSKLLRDIGSRR